MAMDIKEIKITGNENIVNNGYINGDCIGGDKNIIIQINLTDIKVLPQLIDFLKSIGTNSKNNKI